MKRFLHLTVMLLLSANVARAQIIQAVNRFANPGESEAKSTQAVASGERAGGANLLTQASAEIAGSDTTQIGLQAIDLWINKFARLYGRLTLPVSSNQATTGNGTVAGANGAGATQSAAKISDDVVKQLVDPYGGIFNFSGGLFAYLGKPGRGPSEHTIARQMISTEFTNRGVTPDRASNLAEAAVNTIQPDHGAFVDVRGGFKLIDLPNPSDNAVPIGSTKVNVFYTGIAGIKYIANLYDVTPTGTSSDDGHLAGGLTLGAYVVGNYAADPSQSTAIPSLLNRGTAAFTGVVGINLPQVAALTFSVTPWTSDSRLGKSFVVSFNILRPTKDTTQASTQQDGTATTSPDNAQPAPANSSRPSPSPLAPPALPRTNLDIRGMR